MKKIYNLKPFFGVVSSENKLVVIRQYLSKKNMPQYIQLNCKSLETNIVKCSNIKFDIISFNKVIKGTKYETLIQKSLLNANIIRGGISQIDIGYSISIDLCPSKKSLDYHFFNFLLKKKLSPIYICISGMWLKKHLEELEFIKGLNDIEIRWVNHSYNHYFKLNALQENFMLLKNTDVDFEILATEKTLLENNIVPSIFFRFPGLVTNKELSKKIIEYGLLPLGSNSWLAKGENLVNGSIVLVHANGNEPEGLKEFYKHITNSKLKPNFI